MDTELQRVIPNIFRTVFFCHFLQQLFAINANEKHIKSPSYVSFELWMSQTKLFIQKLFQNKKHLLIEAISITNVYIR